jgi:integrase/recombinase XerD
VLAEAEIAGTHERWMDHAQLSTTAIYAEAVSEEERSIAARMWR